VINTVKSNLKLKLGVAYIACVLFVNEYVFALMGLPIQSERIKAILLLLDLYLLGFGVFLISRRSTEIPSFFLRSNVYIVTIFFIVETLLQFSSLALGLDKKSVVFEDNQWIENRMKSDIYKNTPWAADYLNEAKHCP